MSRTRSIKANEYCRNWT